MQNAEDATVTRVVFFDGDCGLCDRFVQFLIRIDKNRRLSFATLQGETSTHTFGLLPESADNWSIKFLDGERSYEKSSGALRAIAAVGGIWSISKIFLLVPRFIRDSVYRWVAVHRYRWFGRRDVCVLPSPTLRERFLP